MKHSANIKVMNATFNNHYSANNIPDIISFPEEVTITVSLKCNYRCIMCYQNNYTDELDMLAVDKIHTILPFAKNVQVFGGEPLLYSGIEDLYQLASDNGCAISTITNGSLLTEKMVGSILDNQIASIKISMDAGTPETYKRIRGGDFYKVLHGVARLTEQKLKRKLRSPILNFNFLAMRSNVHELTRLLVLAKELGVSGVNVFYPSLSTEELARDSVFFFKEYSDEMLTKARETAKHLDIDLNLPALFSESPLESAEDTVRETICRDPWTKAMIQVNGDLKLCCSGSPVLGNLYDQDFEELWNNQKAQGLRKVVNTPREPAFCKRCRIRKGNPNDVKMHMPENIAQKISAAQAA